MTVYFVEMEGSKAIKIGFTAADDVAQRMRQLQTGQPNKLSLLGSIAGDQDAERSLHAIFAAYRVSGEWFEGPAVFRQFLRYMIENNLPWSYSRAYGAFDAMLAEQSMRIEQLESEKANSPALSGGWQEKQMNRIYRRMKEQQQTLEAISQENSALVARLEAIKSSVVMSNGRLLDWLETRQPVLETPIAMVN
jgi:hypothetical protein